jgi:hypothetical protein
VADDIGKRNRNSVNHDQWVQECEAACVVVNAVWSTLFKRSNDMRAFFRWGGEVTLEERNRILGRPWVYSIDYPPIDWSLACEILKRPELARREANIGDTAVSDLAAVALRQLDIRLGDKLKEWEFIGRLNHADRATWAVLLHAADIQEFWSLWHNRLQALSPFSGQELLIFGAGESGRAMRYVLCVAERHGWRGQVVWLKSWGRQEELQIAAVPRCG